MKLSKETALYEKDAIKNGINNAAGTATKYVTLIDDDTGIFVSPEGEGPKDKPNTKTGWSISDAIELFKNGRSYLKAWLGGTVSNPVPTIRIGEENAFNIQVSDDDLTFHALDDDTGEEYQIGDLTASDRGIKVRGGNSFMDLNYDGWYISQGFASIRGNNHAQQVSVLGDMKLFNSLTIQNHSEPIGTIKSATQSQNTPSSDITDYNDGPEVTLSEGTWIVIGTWLFHTLGDANARQTALRLEKDGSVIKNVTICNGASYTTRMEITDVVVVSSSEDPCPVQLYAASSRATSTKDTQSIKAIRIV